MDKLKHLYKLPVALLCLMFLYSCTVQKRKGDMSATKKLYENTTAKYNGYFNANELMKATYLQLEQQKQENYNKVLPVYSYMPVANPQALAPEMDKAIEKVSTVIALHRESQWVDDCYLLMGQALYLKQDYEGAESALKFMVEEYSPQRMEQKKKKLSTSKKKAGGSARIEETSGDPDERATASKEPVLSAKEQAKVRKKYNKELKKKKRSSSNKKKKPSSGKKSTPATKKVEPTKEEPAPAAKVETPAPAPTRIRLADKEDPKVTGEPENYFMKHRPSYYEGMLWLARTQMERGSYDLAWRNLSKLESDPKVFEEIRPLVSMAQAHFFLLQKRYEDALPRLEKAAESADKKTEQARLTYIIAQIHQLGGRGQAAFDAYERTLKLNPDYEMDFNCRLNMTQNSWLSGKSTAEAAIKELEKMLTDIKNDPFRDRIYFTMATIALKSGNKTEAIAYLQQALQAGGANETQKAEAYYSLAKLYFAEEDYIKAQEYYEECLNTLLTTDDRYPEVKKMAQNLSDIATHLRTIAQQDSLLQIAEMSPEEKKKLASKIEAEQRKARQMALESSSRNNQAPTNSRGLAVSPSAGIAAQPALVNSSFFAYNQKNLKKDQKEFEKKWGNRELEDNWRRSNKQSAGGDAADPAVAVANTGDYTDEQLDQLLPDVPSNESEIAEAQRKIRESLFELGKLYRERLENNPKSVEAFEELNKRFPNNSFELESWYYLYLTYTDLNDDAKAKVYFNKIIEKYPQTLYAKVLRDPNYVAEFQKEKMLLNTYYDDTYHAFQQGDFQTAFDRSNTAKEKFGAGNALQPRFALLAALCVGNLKGKESYITALQEVVSKYPNTPEQLRAKELLRLLGETGAALPGGETAKQTTQFLNDPDKSHYILVVFFESVTLNDYQVKVSNYNQKFHQSEAYNISPIYLGTDEKDRRPVLIIRRFKNKDDAMKYYLGVDKNKKDFINATEVDYEIFAVSQDNYRKLLDIKEFDAYRDFFKQNYLNLK